MSINPELLQKAAKVYEAAESVDGEKPKHVYESHKKCAPGEFNMHKEGYAQLQDAIAKVARQKVANPMAEAGVPPKMFPQSANDSFPDVDNLRGVMARQQAQQGLLNVPNAMTVFKQQQALRKATGSGQPAPAPVLPQAPAGGARPAMPPRGLGSAGVKR